MAELKKTLSRYQRMCRASSSEGQTSLGMTLRSRFSKQRETSGESENRAGWLWLHFYTRSEVRKCVQM